MGDVRDLMQRIGQPTANTAGGHCRLPAVQYHGHTYFAPACIRPRAGISPRSATMTEPDRFTMTITTTQPWYVPVGNEDIDKGNLISMIFDLADSGGLQNAMNTMEQITIAGLTAAYYQGIPNYPTISDFVNACVQLSKPATDPPPTVVDLYCQRQVNAFEQTLNANTAIIQLGELNFRSNLRQMGVHRKGKITKSDSAFIVKNSVLWTDGLGSEIAVGFTALSPEGDRYTIVIRSQIDVDGEQLIQKLQSVCDGEHAPYYDTLQAIQYFAVGGCFNGPSVRKAFLLSWQFLKQQLSCLGTYLGVANDQAGFHKAVAILKDGTMCCSSYQANSLQLYCQTIPQTEMVDFDTFSNGVRQANVVLLDCSRPQKCTFVSTGIGGTSILNSLVVGATASHSDKQYNVLICPPEDQDAEDTIDAIIACFDGTNFPVFTDVAEVKFFIVGGSPTRKSIQKVNEIAAEFRERRLIVLGVSVFQHVDDIGLIKSVVLTNHGHVICATRRPTDPTGGFSQITLMNIKALRKAANDSRYYEVGKGFAQMDYSEYDQPWCMIDTGIWTDHMGPCLTVGFTATWTDPQDSTQHRYNGMVHSMSFTINGSQLIVMLRSLFGRRGMPKFTDLDEISFFVVGGSSEPLAVKKMNEVLTAMRTWGLRILGAFITTGAEFNGLTKAIMLTADGRLFASVYDSKQI